MRESLALCLLGLGCGNAGELVDRSALRLGVEAIHHVIVTGQSLATGYGASPAISTDPAPVDLMPQYGTDQSLSAGLVAPTSLVPLRENSVETLASGFAGAVDDSWPLLLSIAAQNGQPYASVKKRQNAFIIATRQVTGAKAIAASLGRPYDVSAIVVIHGESDISLQTPNYDACLVQWESDFQQDLSALTGQTSTIPLLLAQVSSWTKYGQATSKIPIAQLQAAFDNPRTMALAAPEYFLPHQADGVHLTADGERTLGRYMAKAYQRQVVDGGRWEPLRPVMQPASSRIFLSGSTVYVPMVVPVPPLVADCTAVTDPGHWGLEYFDDSATPPTITGQTILGSQVRVTLSAAPTSTRRRLRYAYTGVVGASAGPTTGPRGCLRDSDTLPNWAVTFDEAIY